MSRVTRISSKLTAILLALSSLAAWLPRCRSGHARLAPRIVVVRAAPVLDEVAQLLVRPLRQHDAQLHVLIADLVALARRNRSEEHTSELQSLMRISYAVFCLKKKNNNN